MTPDWWSILGHPVSERGVSLTIDLLASEGFHRGTATMAVGMVAHAIAKDKPDVAISTMRWYLTKSDDPASHVSGMETLLFRALATLGAN